MREFIRHANEIPVAVKVAGEAGSRRGHLRAESRSVANLISIFRHCLMSLPDAAGLCGVVHCGLVFA